MSTLPDVLTEDATITSAVCQYQSVLKYYLLMKVKLYFIFFIVNLYLEVKLIDSIQQQLLKEQLVSNYHIFLL